MKKIIYLVCLLLGFSFSVVSIEGQTRPKQAKKPIVKKGDSLVAEAEKAWPQYWGKFRAAVVNHDKPALRNLMFWNITCPWGYSVNQDPRDGCLEHFEKKSTYKSVWDLGYSLRQVVKPGGWAKIRGASDKPFKTNSTFDQVLVVYRSIHCVDKSDCTAQFDFEFREHRWQWSYFASGCD